MRISETNLKKQIKNDSHYENTFQYMTNVLNLFGDVRTSGGWHPLISTNFAMKCKVHRTYVPTNWMNSPRTG